MRATLARFEDPVYAILRFLSGMMFACHGAQKLLGLFGGQVQPTFSFVWVGGLIELVAGLLIAAGLLTRAAAFLSSGEMMVAYFGSHFAFKFANLHWVPLVNKGELAVVYCFLFLYICMRGPGRASLDRVFGIDH
jgi:putative oxidoreductase